MATTYTTREAIKAALDIAETARANPAIDRANEAATDTIDGQLRRSFRPVTATRRFPWPHPDRNSNTWRLWLNQHELVSLDTLTVAGTTYTSSEYYLEPDGSGPPYDRIEINLGSTVDGYTAGDTFQRSISVTGVFGYRNDQVSAGTIAEGLDTSETGVDIDGTAAAATGVGDYLLVDSEYLHVTDRTWLDTGENTGANQTATMSDNDLTVSDGTTYTAGELIQVDAETMRIVSISGNVLTLRRAWDGSTLAAHTSGADIYASRTLTVERGALGTTAAIHTTAAALTRHRVPALVEQATILEALVELGLSRSGGALESGQGATSRNASGAGVAGVWERCMRAHGRHGRFRSVG